MNKKRVHFHYYLSIFLFLFILIEISYMIYQISFQKVETIYFEGVNAIVSTDHYYVAVGSNNDNDNHFEKAKISKFNLKKEKTFEKLYNIGYNSAFFGLTVDGDDVIAVGSYEKNEKH